MAQYEPIYSKEEQKAESSFFFLYKAKFLLAKLDHHTM